MTEAAAGPIQSNERIELVDILRGFALFGVLIVNWGQTSGAYNRLIQFWASGSFYTVFSFLFGLGFSLQMIRAEQAGRPFVVRYLWRTVLLFLIGAWHSIFIWSGDILRLYALTAPVLLVVQRAKPWLLLLLATTALLVSLAPLPSTGDLVHRVDPEQVDIQRLEELAADRVPPPAWCYWVPGLSGTYRGDVCSQAAFVRKLSRQAYVTIEFWQGLWGYKGVLCMFLLGLYVGRTEILNEPRRHTRLLVAVASVCLLLGLSGNALELYRAWFQENWGLVIPADVGRWLVTGRIGDTALGVFYASALALLLSHSQRVARVFAPLGAVGRLGLTNYLAQSIIFVCIFGPRGFNVLKEIEGGYRLIVVCAVFALQVLYSVWWVRHFRFGPAEWVWRSLTWWRRQPMRLSQGHAAHTG